MKEQYLYYLLTLYQGTPTEVNEGLISIFCLGAVGLIAFFGWKRGWRKIVCLLLVEYVSLIYCSTVICRKVSEDICHNLYPFWSYEAISNGREDLLAENIMNVVIFIPIGLLLSCLSPNIKWWMVLLIGVGISVSIEILQYILNCGFSETDDVIHNSFGCMVGYGVLSLIKWTYGYNKGNT